MTRTKQEWWEKNTVKWKELTTISPMVRFETIRQIFALGGAKGIGVHQMDVTTTFVSAPLEEKVYMAVVARRCVTIRE